IHAARPLRHRPASGGFYPKQPHSAAIYECQFSRERSSSTGDDLRDHGLHCRYGRACTVERDVATTIRDRMRRSLIRATAHPVRDGVLRLRKRSRRDENHAPNGSGTRERECPWFLSRYRRTSNADNSASLKDAFAVLNSHPTRKAKRD